MSKLDKYSKKELCKACDRIEDQLMDGYIDLSEDLPYDEIELRIIIEAYKQFKPRLQLEGADK